MCRMYKQAGRKGHPPAEAGAGDFAKSVAGASSVAASAEMGVSTVLGDLPSSFSSPLLHPHHSRNFYLCIKFKMRT